MPVSPNAIKTWREGEVVSGAKSDSGDAEVIAEYLRLRQHRLRITAPYAGETRALRTVVRTRDDVVDLRVAAVNQLGALLDAHWPGGKAIFADLESRIALSSSRSAASLGCVRADANDFNRCVTPGRHPGGSLVVPLARADQPPVTSSQRPTA